MDPNLREVERCRLCITLHPGLLLPLSPPISVLNLSIVFERSNPFLEAEEYFFKSNYRQVYQVSVNVPYETHLGLSCRNQPLSIFFLQSLHYLYYRLIHNIFRLSHPTVKHRLHVVSPPFL